MHLSRPEPGICFYGAWTSTKKQRRLGLHRNDGLEIVLVTKGEVRWAIDGRVAPVKANMFFYTLPWQEHGGIEEIQPSCEILYLCLALKENYRSPRRRFRFHLSLGFSAKEEVDLSTALTGRARQTIPADEPGAWLMHHFFEAAKDRSAFRRRITRDTIRMLLLTLAKRAAGRISAPENGLPEAQKRVRNFVALLAERSSDPWTLETMSASCRLGRTQLATLVKEMTGDTPFIYLNRVRVQAAQKLLANSEKSITEIAHAAGFNSSQYFATVFKEFTGTTPGSYRASART